MSWSELGKLYADNQEWKFRDEQERKKMKKQMQSKMVYDAWKQYDRDVMLSEYVTVPKSRLRRLIITEVIAWGISIFLLLISVLR